MDARQANERYLELLKVTLTRDGFPMPYRRLVPAAPWKRSVVRLVQRALGLAGLELVRRPGPAKRGRHPDAETMIGRVNLDSLHELVRTVIAEGVPGDLAETGVWRGGSAILMRALLDAYGDTERVVWAADSFEGLPAPDERYPADAGSAFHRDAELVASLDEVRANFERYGLLDDRVRFLPGWFEDTLPSAPIERLAVLRLDGDMYSSTMQALQALYPKLSPGGFLIVDDYGLTGARAAVDDYRAQMGITDPITHTGSLGCAYWRVT